MVLGMGVGVGWCSCITELPAALPVESPPWKEGGKEAVLPGITSPLGFLSPLLPPTHPSILLPPFFPPSSVASFPSIPEVLRALTEDEVETQEVGASLATLAFPLHWTFHLKRTTKKLL